MSVKILMPALSPTMTEGTLSKWHVAEGDTVAPGDVIAEIETDKATMEVESVDEGVVGRLLVAEGTEGVQVNDVIGILLEEGEDAASIGDIAAGAPIASGPDAAPVLTPGPVSDGGGERVRASPLARRVAAQVGVDISGIAGTGAGGRIVLHDVEMAAGGGVAAVQSVTSLVPPAAPTGARIVASPLARRLAREAGIDLAAVRGSGPAGRIVKSDIDAIRASATAVGASGVKPAPRPRAATPLLPSGAGELVKMSTMRRVIAERMSESKRDVPHFYMTVDCEIDELLKLRATMNERLAPAKISVNDFVIRACAMALMEVPDANVSWAGEGQMFRHGGADISVAVAIEGGLITPIVRGAESKSLVQIAADMQDLAARARDGKLAPEEYQGGSFSISNLGMFGIKQFDAVINPPQACILAVGAGEKRPVVRDDAIVPATVMSCTLSVDHRVVDGAIGAQLLAAIKRLIEYPPEMLI